MLRRFWSSEDGATAIEYAMIAVFLSITIVAAARTIGGNLSAKYYMPVANNLT